MKFQIPMKFTTIPQILWTMGTSFVRSITIRAPNYRLIYNSRLYMGTQDGQPKPQRLHQNLYPYLTLLITRSRMRFLCTPSSCCSYTPGTPYVPNVAAKLQRRRRNVAMAAIAMIAIRLFHLKLIPRDSHNVCPCEQAALMPSHPRL